MNLIAVFAVVLGLIALCAVILRSPKSYTLANIAGGQHGTGNVTFFPDGVTTSLYLLGQAGSDSSHIALGDATHRPLGVITDQVDDLTIPINVALLGATKGTLKVTASAAIAANDLVAAAASGQVKTLPTAAGTYWVVGLALKAATASGDIIEIVPVFPYSVIVS